MYMYIVKGNNTKDSARMFTCAFSFYFRFTQNLSLLIKDINDILKGPYTSVNSVSDMMAL